MNEEFKTDDLIIIDMPHEKSPLHHINEKEFDDSVYKFGSLLYLIHNKNINPTTLFLTILKNDNFKHVFLKITGVNNTVELLKLILIKYPNLVKSKMLKDTATKIIRKEKKKIESIKNKPKY